MLAVISSPLLSCSSIFRAPPDGLSTPCSHLLTDAPDTPHSLPNSLWVSFFSLRNSFISCAVMGVS